MPYHLRCWDYQLGPFLSRVGAVTNAMSELRKGQVPYVDIHEDGNEQSSFRLYRNGQYVDRKEFLTGITHVFKDKNGLFTYLKGE